MRKVKEVLRLRFELQLGEREIARACSISQGAVHNYLKKSAAAGIGWPPPEDGAKNASKKHSSVIAIPSNGGNAPFPTLLRSTSSSSNIVI
jgi:predicted transcriptional regulator